MNAAKYGHGIGFCKGFEKNKCDNVVVSSQFTVISCQLEFGIDSKWLLNGLFGLRELEESEIRNDK